MPFSAAIVECYKQIGAGNNTAYFKEQVTQLIELQKEHTKSMESSTMVPMAIGTGGVHAAYPVPNYNTPGTGTPPPIGHHVTSGGK